jgi:hypothetical protein
MTWRHMPEDLNLLMHAFLYSVTYMLLTLPLSVLICLLIWIADTQQADYHVVASVMYRANGAVATPCLAQYSDLLAQYYTSLNHVLTQRCSAVNVNMSVSFVDLKPRLLEENVVQVRYHRLVQI